MGNCFLIIHTPPRLHTFGAGDVEHRQHVFDYRADAAAQRKPCLHKRLLLALNAAGVVELVEQRRKLCHIARNLCRIVVLRRADDLVSVQRKVADKLLFLGSCKQRELVL